MVITTPDTIVNRYTPLTTSAAAGATSLAVGSVLALDASPGDLLMVMQVQGATIDTAATTTAATYGAVTSLNGAGLYELVTVASVNALTNTVTLSGGCGLQHAYSAAAHSQVIWVPQYQSLTVSGAGSITAPAWNGSIGGVVAIEAVTSSLTAPGAINVTGLGFRGGVVKQDTTLPVTQAPAVVTTNIALGSEKGESIAGFETEYDANGGRYGIGAPANGGGGGGPHNSGGGGGANGNNGNVWTGAGVMTTTVTGAAAWALDPEDIAANALTDSSGGGRGGYSFANVTNNPLTTGPGNAVWGGDYRQNHGGRGGQPLTYNGISQLFLGGGGGSGESNNATGTSGAPGGGLVVVAGTSLDGASTGSILANGGSQTTAAGNDGAGGGGGGGTIVLLEGSVTNVTLSAAGGSGGSQMVGGEVEGLGGGGGGGFIAVPSTFMTTAPAGGAAGTTNSAIVTTSTNPAGGFPVNGATQGAPGQVASLAAGTLPAQCIATSLSIVMTDTPGPATPGDTETYTIVVTNSGPNPVAGATLSDVFSTSGQFGAVTWTCTGAGCPAAMGTGDLNEVLGLLSPTGPNDQVTFTVTATVATSATGTLSNTASIAPPTGIVNSNAASSSVTVTNMLTGSADLSVTVANTPSSVAVGSGYSYTAVVTNAGPSDAAGVTVSFTLPTGVTGVTGAGVGWTCVYTAPTETCTLTGALAAGANSSVTVTLTAPATPGPGTTTVTASATTADPNANNNTATDTFSFQCAVTSDCPNGDYCNAGTCTLACTGNHGTTGANPCGASAPYCSTSGACTVGCTTDAECGHGAWCDETTAVCTPTLANGTAVPTDSNHRDPTLNGKCTVAAGALVCQSGVCDTTDDKCGYDDGDGPCTSSTGATVCRSGVCSANGTCMAAGSCDVDADCAAEQWCDESMHTCTATLANGTAIPTDGPHTNPTLNGTCSAAAGALVCQSGVCDDSGNACGYANGDGPCTSSTGATVCRSGVCSANGTCEAAGACNVDADCPTHEWCDESAHACKATLSNGTVIPTDGPHTDPTLNGQCTTAAATLVCSSAVCDVKDNECGYANGDGPCTSANGATICRSGVCGSNGTCGASTGCNVDSDCPAHEWCDESAHTCKATLANGTAIPTDATHTGPTLNGRCTTAAATLVCTSQVCDPKDNACGYASGDGTCTSTSEAAVCRSGACSTSGVCEPAGGCLVDADCPTAESPVCDTTTSKCESATAAGYVAAGGGCQAGRADAGDLDAAWVGLVGLAVFGVRRRRRDPQSR